MPNYISSPYKPQPQLLVMGVPAFVWGSWKDKTGPTIIQVTQSKTNGTTTATIQFKIVSGDIPNNGSLLTLVGSAVSANLNVTNVAIANVTAVNSPDDGTYTCTYTITSTATPTTFTPDGAQGVIPQPEIGETISGTGASVPVAVGTWNNSGRSLSVTLVLGAGISGVTATLEGSNFDIAGSYNTVATIGTGLGVSTTEWQSGQGDTATGTLAAGSVTFLNFRFFRINITAITGSGPVIAKIMD